MTTATISNVSEAERLEAHSRKYANDTLHIRQLSSGRWAVFAPDYSLLGVTSIEGVPALAVPLQTLAAAARQRFEAEAAFRARQAAENAALDAALGASLDNLELDLDV